MKIVFLSNQLFDYPLKTNKWHVATRVAERGHDVLFVDPPIRFRKLVKQVVQGRWSIQRLANSTYSATNSKSEILSSKQIRNSKHKIGNITVYTPLTSTLSEAPNLTGFNVQRMKKQCPNFFKGDAVLWVYNPAMIDYIDKIPHKKLVYDCVDDYSSMANYKRLGIAGQIEEKERSIAEKADIVFATTKFLAEKLEQWNNNVHYVGNAGDYGRFAWVQDSRIQNQLRCHITRHSGLDPESKRSTQLERTVEFLSEAKTPKTKIKLWLRILKQVQDDLKSIPRPRIGFTGAIDAYKVNLPLLVEVAKKHSDKSLVLVGPTGVADDQPDLSQLRKMDNAYLLGQKPYEQMPVYFSRFDVYIIPYNLNDYTVKGCFPVKFLDALAAGLPTVVTNLPAYEEFADVCYIAKDNEQFSQLIQTALDEDSKKHIAQRKSTAKQNSWDNKVDKMLRLMQ